MYWCVVAIPTDEFSIILVNGIWHPKHSMTINILLNSMFHQRYQWLLASNDGLLPSTSSEALWIAHTKGLGLVLTFSLKMYYISPAYDIFIVLYNLLDHTYSYLLCLSSDLFKWFVTFVSSFSIVRLVGVFVVFAFQVVHSVGPSETCGLTIQQSHLHSDFRNTTGSIEVLCTRKDCVLGRIVLHSTFYILLVNCSLTWQIKIQQFHKRK